MYKGFELEVTMDVGPSETKIGREKSLTKESSTNSYADSFQITTSEVSV